MKGEFTKIMERLIREISPVDILIIVLGAIILQTRIHETFSPPISYLIYKSILVSIGFVHARITRILVYGRINWNEEKIKPKHVLAIAIYVVFILAYSLGA